MRGAAFLLLALTGCQQTSQAPAAPAEKQEVALLTSLPIVFAESFSLDQPANPLLVSLEEGFVVRPVDGPEQLAPGGLLLAVQPQALTAERLVALDRWVRDGGRLVLLADPKLAWESSRPLGSPFRPPVSYPDTGLLARWGLALSGGQDGSAQRMIGKTAVATISPGQLEATGNQCQIKDAGFHALCRIGRGSVHVIADADWVLGDLSPEDPSAAEPEHAVLITLLAGA